jgi:hypothetical protein
MSAEAALQDAYREWRRLAEAEAEAIRAENWLLVSDCQRAMEQLQSRITSCTDEARREWSRPGVDRKAREQTLHTTINELVEIEHRNNALLNLARSAAQEHAQELSEAGRTLRRVQRSYAPAPAPVWTSFS